MDLTDEGVVKIYLAVLVVASMTAGTAVAQERGSPGNSSGVGFDLQHYDCEETEFSQTKHVGQYLRGRYQEWLESYVVEGNERHTICISQLVPSIGTLSERDALSLLKASAGLDDQERASAISNSASHGRVIEDPRQIDPIPLGIVDPASRESSLRERSQSVAPSTKTKSAPHVPSTIETFAIREGVPVTGRPQDSAGSSSPTVKESSHAPPINNDQPPPQPLFRDTAPTRDDETGSATVEDNRKRALVDSVDDRIRVGSATTFPWNTIAFLYIRYPDGTEGSCTGTLVGPYTVLTAGHCIHSRDHGGFASSVSVAPGQTQSTFFGVTSQPFGERFAQRGVTTDRWKSTSGGSSHTIREYKYDYAAVFFDQPWTHTQTFMPIVYDDPNGGVNLAGYPGIVDNKPNTFGMFTEFGPESLNSILFWRDLQLREFVLDASPGNSGGPFFLYYSATNANELTGTASYIVQGEEIAGGPWMGGENETTIKSWVNWTPDIELPTAQKDGVRLTALLGTGSYASFFRFFNASAESGTAQVTLSDAVTGETLGNWISGVVEPRASRQFAVSEIQDALSLSNAPSLFYAANITSEFDGYMQHIAWNPDGASLTNLTGCGTGLSNDVISIMNFHSSNLSDGYSSIMYFHNVGSETAEAIVDIYDAVDGNYIGGFIWREVPPDGTRSLDSEGVDFYLNEFFGFTPSASQSHYNIELNGDFPGYMQHAIDNTGAGVVTSMTAKCDLRAE